MGQGHDGYRPLDDEGHGRDGHGLAHSRGWLDYGERVATYWPEFAQNGKERITIRQLLAHQAGLFAFDEPVDRNVIADLDRLAGVMARQRPAWAPGERQAYHAISLGFYQGELIRRVDPAHRTLGQVFDQDIAKPRFSLGFMKPSESISFGHPGAFGMPGAGGSMGYADPETGIGYGYVTNRMGTSLKGDPREVALRNAIPAKSAQNLETEV